jgi:hypothetical protein
MGNPAHEFSPKLADVRIRAAVQSTLDTPTARYWQIRLHDWDVMEQPITDDEWRQVGRLLVEGTDTANDHRIDPTVFLTTAAAYADQASWNVGAHVRPGRDD